MNRMIQQIAIVGSGVCVRMAAAILSQSLKAFGIRIVVLELADLSANTQVESSGPEFSALSQILGLDEREVIRQCAGTFRLGSLYHQKSDFFVPFAHIGLNPEQDDFEQGLFQTQLQQNNLNDWCIASSAAMAGKFAIAGKDRPDLRLALDYGVNLNTQKYASLLQTVCQSPQLNWHQVSEAGLQVERDSHNNIVAMHDSAQRFTADFWFDLRPVEASNLQNKQTDWQAWHRDIAISHRCEWFIASTNLNQPFTHMHRMEGAWLKVIPLRNQTCYQMFADFELTSEAQLKQQLLIANVLAPDSFGWSQVNVGARQAPWQANCLCLGQAAIELGGLHFSSLQCLQSALVQFVDLFPDLPILAIHRKHYNQQWRHFVEDAFDYTAAHFLNNNNAATSGAITLQQRLDVFRRLGRLNPLQSDAVNESQWYNLLFGLGLRPQLASVTLSNKSPLQLQTASERVKVTIRNLVAGMPAQQDYLQRFYPCI